MSSTTALAASSSSDLALRYAKRAAHYRVGHMVIATILWLR